MLYSSWMFMGFIKQLKQKWRAPTCRKSDGKIMQNLLN